MLQIREGMFETNSSSSHSIVMTKMESQLPEEVDPKYYVYDGILEFYCDDLDFERAPFDFLTDWYGRLRYAMASYAEDEKVREEIKEICKKRIKGFKDFRFPRDYDDEPHYGYVDHQSCGLLQSFLQRKSVSLEDFIFNDRYIVVIDGDEYHIFNRIMESPLFNKDNMEDRMRA